MLTTVADGIAIKVQGNPAHPHTDGALCTKVSRYTERTYHPERLRYPLKRVGPKGAGQFERVSWDSALRDIAARLTTIANRGPGTSQAILPYSFAGTMGLVQGESLSARFFHRLGASLLDRTICSSAGVEGLNHTLGGKVGMRMEFFAEARLILTASEEARLRRRGLQLGGTQSAAQLAEQVLVRDAKDSTVVDFQRAADGVYTVDSSDLDFEQTVSAVINVVRQSVNAGPTE